MTNAWISRETARFEPWDSKAVVVWIPEKVEESPSEEGWKGGHKPDSWQEYLSAPP